MARLTPDHVFSRIHRRYDRLNRVLSLGRDRAWRRRGIAHLPDGTILDLGAGTGAAMPLFRPGQEVVALDPVWPMLSVNPASRRVVGRGERLPFADRTFDGVWSAFVFRNLDSIRLTLAEAARVLRPGGVLVVVDAGRPIGPVSRALHRTGTAVLSPLVGLLGGAVREYWYFHRSLDRLPHPEEMFAGGPLRVAELWRMGIGGGVYGACLVRRGD